MGARPALEKSLLHSLLSRKDECLVQDSVVGKFGSEKVQALGNIDTKLIQGNRAAGRHFEFRNLCAFQVINSKACRRIVCERSR